MKIFQVNKMQRFLTIALKLKIKYDRCFDDIHKCNSQFTRGTHTMEANRIFVLI